MIKICLIVCWDFFSGGLGLVCFFCSFWQGVGSELTYFTLKFEREKNA